MSEKVKERRNKIGFALVFTGLLFFFNPCVNLFDVFPDMFGVLLIYTGLRKQSAVDGYFEDARKLSFYLIFLYIAKFAFSFSVLSNSDNSLPYTFISSVVELIFLLPFFHKLFAGFEYTLMRSTGEKHSVRTNEPYAFTMIFVIVKCVSVVLVELFELITQGSDLDLSANAAYYISLANTKKYAILLSVFVQLVLGVIFIYQMTKFFRAIKKHPYYYKELSEKYANELTVNRTKHLNKTLSAAYSLAVAAVLFLADILLEGFDLLPDMIAAFLMILSFIVLTYAADYVRVPKLSAVLLGAAGILSTAFSVYVNPERFYLLSKEKSMFENRAAGFFEKSDSVMITAAVGLILTLAFIYAVVKWICCNRMIYKKELMGNHDRKLLTSGVLTSAAVLLKSVSFTVDCALAHLATNEAVSDFISDRAVLTPQRMAERIAADERVALFTNLENASFIISFLAIAVVVFAVFNIFALKAEAVKEEV